jgi:hypothetical protein
LAHSHLFHFVRRSFTRGERARVSGQVAGRITSSIEGTRRIDQARLDHPDEETVAEGVRLGQALFRRLNGWCQARQIPLFVLTTGFQGKYHVPPEWAGPIDIAFLKSAEGFFAREGIPFKDLTPELVRVVNGQWGNYVIVGDGHPNAAGAKLVAELAWPWLRPHLHRLLISSSKRSGQ